jgi:hypothetical protein
MLKVEHPRQFGLVYVIKGNLENVQLFENSYKIQIPETNPDGVQPNLNDKLSFIVVKSLRKNINTELVYFCAFSAPPRSILTLYFISKNSENFSCFFEFV